MKTVNFPIKVPSGKYCCQWTGPFSQREVCDYFDNTGGHATCDLGFSNLGKSADGVVKSPDCQVLKKCRGKNACKD